MKMPIKKQLGFNSISIQSLTALRQPLVACLCSLLYIACPDGQARADYARIFSSELTEFPVASAPGSSKKIAVTIFTPPRVRGNVLVLPGWKFNRKRWLKKTNLKSMARTNHLRLICPEMHTSLYASQYYPQSKRRWSILPGQQWVLEMLIPSLQKKGMLRADQDNFLLGLSTGGRGVALLGLARPELWRAAAALSGDFDQSAMPADRLMTALYGSYAEFPDRWRGRDNPQMRINEWQLPLYLAHGSIDPVVPFMQSRHFHQALVKSHPDLDIVLHAPAAGHNFKFWGAQNKASIDFFRKHSRHNLLPGPPSN